METIGEIDERGFLETFERKGFDILSSADELISNAYDAAAKNVIISKEGGSIAISDDGHGMDMTDAKFMFAMYKPKNRNGTIGMANSGAKPSLYKLSNKKQSIIISLKDGIYITILIDWAKMLFQNKYTNNIHVKPSLENEIKLFNEIGLERTSGTTILFKYVETTWNILEFQFNFENDLEISKSFSVRYGHTKNFNIKMINDSDTLELIKYNPRNNENEIQRRIDILRNSEGETRFISDKNEEIKPFGRGFNKSPTVIDLRELEGYTLINSLEIFISLPHDAAYHKDAKTWYPPHLNMFKQNDENDKIIASSHPTLVRNNYALGSIIIEETSLANRRASYEGRLYYDVYTLVKSNQTHLNSIDDIIGTQENKGQLQNNMPIQIKRLIHHFKTEYINKLKGPKPKPVPRPQPAPPPAPPQPSPPQPSPLPQPTPSPPQPSPSPSSLPQPVFPPVPLQPSSIPLQPPSPHPKPVKPMTIVHEYVKGKIEHAEYNEMLEFFKKNEKDINENEITIKIYNLYLDLKR
jgi:hypothetical protein